MKTTLLVIALLFLAVSTGYAWMNRRDYYDSNGMPAGSSQSFGNTTNYYGSNGMPQGFATHFGSMTNYYDSNGMPAGFSRSDDN